MNTLYPDQTRQKVEPGLGPSCLTLFFEIGCYCSSCLKYLRINHLFGITQSKKGCKVHPQIELDKGGYDAHHNKNTFQSIHQKLKLRMSTASKNTRNLIDLRILSGSSQLLHFLSKMNLQCTLNLSVYQMY